MGGAYGSLAAALYEGKKRGRFHLDRDQSACSQGGDGELRLPTGRIGRKGRAAQHLFAESVKGTLERSGDSEVCLGERR